MLKLTTSKSARSIWRDRLAITGDGLHLRSRRLSLWFDRFLHSHPRLLLRELDLSKLLMGGENGIASAGYARSTGDLLRPSRTIAESPHVRLLESYIEEGERVLDPGRFESTAYYRNAANCIEMFGKYFAMKDPRDLVGRARKFCRMVDGEEFGEHECGESPPKSHVRVRRISLSDCHEIIDGHHRLAVAYVKGCRKYNCLVEPFTSILTPLQQMILDSHWTDGRREIYQPIPAPELADWPVPRRCVDRLGMMTDDLEKAGMRGGTYLDICCSYGWFVSRMAARGFEAKGIDRDRAAVCVGRLAFGLPESATQVGDVVEFLDSNRGRRYDVVSCFSILHHFVLGTGRIKADEFIRKVDDMTGSVLFLDTGESHEGWFAASLAGWDAEYIRNWLGQHTTFDEIEILGVDSDDVGPYRGQYRRHLFACRRSG
jgi:2-polyprenyl-3-methyl-5-hydroxy-6-metoxy-1,4-benzoquinol methylase